MGNTEMGTPERAIRWTTTLSVIALAIIAAIVSYKHVYLLVRRYGEASWTAALLPVSVDGMIVASSMSLLLDSRCSRRSGLLPWALLIVGSAASLAANVAVAEPSAVGRLIAGWPSCALIGSYELLMRQIRHASARHVNAESTASFVFQTMSVAEQRASERLQTSFRAPTAPPEESLANRGFSSGVPTGSHTNGLVDSTVHPDGSQCADDKIAWRQLQRGDRRDLGIRKRAWQWAIANRTPEGQLPPGKEIAHEFGRSERWGRLVKQTGLAGQFDRKHPAEAQAPQSARP